MYKVPAHLLNAWPIVAQVRGPTRPSRFTRDATRPGMADQPSSVGTGHNSKAQAPKQGSALATEDGEGTSAPVKSAYNSKAGAWGTAHRTLGRNAQEAIGASARMSKIRNDRKARSLLRKIPKRPDHPIAPKKIKSNRSL